MDVDHYTAPQLRGRRLLSVTVPAPIHQVLMDAGFLDDPNIGLNSLRARWVEEQFWVYRHTFTAPAEAAEQPAWLVFERLELDTIVSLNGQEVGRHANANRPARFCVSGKVRAGENLLVVQISTGIHGSADKPGADYWCQPMDMLTKRPWHRKPAYQCGWDWNARLMNVGILGDVHLEWSEVPRLDQVTVFAVPTADLTSATVHVRATVENADSSPAEATLSAAVAGTKAQASRKVVLQPGDNRVELVLALGQPKLWWPIDHGEQHRYSVNVTLAAGTARQERVLKTGVRRVEIDQSAHPVEGKHFILRINNRPIFCKGGNWVPPDMLYSTVTPERYRQLVDLAIGANFNMLRIWGGGTFVEHALADLCDERGILLWHDFLFACAKYPGDDPAFAAEARQEVTRAVRELAHHPSLVVWCGNNEIEWGDWAWGYDTKPKTHPHYALFHHDIPKIVHEEDCSKVHWLSSPYSPDFKHPNDPTVGDQHPWGVSILAPGGADWWQYRSYVDRFPNEGGILGTSSPATLRQFLPERERHVLSPSWDHHDNPLAANDAQAGAIGRAYQTVELWTGRSVETMDCEDYAFCSALCQAEGLQEYITNYRRRMFSSAAAIFWMYNDSWPVTHGWTIVDYYLRKKLSYHPVRRAFRPITVVVAADDEQVTVYGVNDTPRDFVGELRYGLFNLAGGIPTDRTIKAALPANASTPLASFTHKEWEKLGPARSGAFAVLYEGKHAIAQHRLFIERFKDLAFAEPRIALSLADDVLTLRSDVFAWGVCLDMDGELPLADNCFDLLPGISYVMSWPGHLPKPAVVKVGSQDALCRG